MTDRLDFETRLAERLGARAAIASRPFDAAAIAHATVTSDARRPFVRRLVWPSMRPGLALLILAGLLAIALLAVALAGALHVNPLQPPAFPIATGNGWIAVSANPMDVGGGENGDIYRVEVGSPARRIIGSDGDGLAQACPRFSPDGLWLAYGEATASGAVTTFRGNWPVTNRAVAIVRVGRESLTLDDVHKHLAPDGGPIVCPEWSPDGKSVAVIVGPELWIIDAKTAATTVIPLTITAPGKPEFEWSRDGSSIAVAQAVQIRVVHVADQTFRLIPAGDTPIESLQWTAGDRGIVFAAAGGPRGDSSVVRVVDPRDRSGTTLTLDPTDPAVRLDIHSVVVSPDGTRVAWVEGSLRCTAGSCAGLPARLMTRALDGSPAVELPVPVGLGGLQWSPAGDRLLISSTDGLVSVGLAAGTTPTVLSHGDLNLEWSWDEVTWQPLFR
jgi:Tol biopolymer transport system component